MFDCKSCVTVITCCNIKSNEKDKKYEKNDDVFCNVSIYKSNIQ